MVHIVNVYEAKTHFSKILDRVMNGEEIIIAKAGMPVARLVPIFEKPTQRVPGGAAGKGRIAPGFDGPLPEEVLKDFET